MKRLISLAIMLLAVTRLSAGDDDSFFKAQSAYDDGRYAEAVLLYNKLLDEGIRNSEVHYNLANAYFKENDLPDAVRHYRKAWYDAPRDPDIRANLHFALNAAGAVEASPSFFERILQSLSLSEWLMIAVGSYLLLTMLLVTALLVPAGKRNALKFCLLPIALILLSSAGWWHWHKLNVNPEWVVVQTEATALFGPVEGSTAHYKLPLAALVRQLHSDSKGWVEVEYDGKRGWLRMDYISRVSP